MAAARANAEIPTLQVNLDTDPLRADHQLQQALHLNASRDDLLQSSPNTAGYKHSRAGSASSGIADSDVLSDVTGRFDDADELESYQEGEEEYEEYGMHYYSPALSTKRRRSNDWPAQQNQGQDDERPRHHENSFSRRWRLYHTGRRPNQYAGSPRAAGAAPRPRRSRFIEGNMNDSVSEKPPSIFLRDDGQLQEDKGADHMGANHRSSGIFRFGKAIASAFNPFGGWGSVSDVWKGGSEEENHHQQSENDDIAQVQKAYEELKKAGFKGTRKGSYMQDARADSSGLPEQTWKAIQEKMDYQQPSASGGHSRQISGESHESTGSTSIRTSLQDLRKAKSSLGISSVKSHTDRGSEDSGCFELRKQKSRKELMRQAKLLKKVSNLEDKLTRTRRELRELNREQEEMEPVPVPTTRLEEKPYYPRKFVPGALPTLPSERFLEDQAAAEEKELSAGHLKPMSPNISRDNKHAAPKSTTQSPKETRPSSSTLNADSPSLKRKSPDPQSMEDVQVTESKNNSSKQDKDEDQPMAGPDPLTTLINTPPGNRLRKAKLQKMGKGDSPGSVERKQSQEQLDTHDNNNNNTLLTPGRNNSRGRGGGRGKSRYLKSSSPQPSPSAAKRSPSASGDNRTGPFLRMKKGRTDLRSASVSVNGDYHDRMDCDDSSPQNHHQNLFYMQERHHLDPDQNASSASPSPSRGKDRSRARYEYIPPVPPLPKDIAATAAKVDKRLAKELERRQQQLLKQQGKWPSNGSSNGNSRKTVGQRQGKGEFEWPEDIF